MFFQSVPEVRHLISIGPKINAGRPAAIPEQSPRTGIFRPRLWHQYANTKDSAPLPGIAQCVGRATNVTILLQWTTERLNPILQREPVESEEKQRRAEATAAGEGRDLQVLDQL
jgi:hypothetical protein